MVITLTPGLSGYYLWLEKPGVSMFIRQYRSLTAAARALAKANAELERMGARA